MTRTDVEVLPCDREAAAAFMLEVYGDRLVGDKARREEVQQGKHDGNLFVQAFARHRHQTSSPTREPGEALVEQVAQFPPTNAGSVASPTISR